MHRQPPPKTVGSITYYSATRTGISNTHLWQFWRSWSRHKCSIGSFAWARVIVSALSESFCWSEYIGIGSNGRDCNNKVAKTRRIVHLDVSLPISFTRPISHLWLAVFVTQADSQFSQLLRLQVPIMVVTMTLVSVTTGLLIMLSSDTLFSRRVVTVFLEDLNQSAPDTIALHYKAKTPKAKWQEIDKVKAIARVVRRTPITPLICSS